MTEEGGARDYIAPVLEKLGRVELNRGSSGVVGSCAPVIVC